MEPMSLPKSVGLFFVELDQKSRVWELVKPNKKGSANGHAVDAFLIESVHS